MDDGVAELDLNGNCSGSNVAHCKAGTFCDVQERCSKCVNVVTIVLFRLLGRDIIHLSLYLVLIKSCKVWVWLDR